MVFMKHEDELMKESIAALTISEPAYAAVQAIVRATREGLETGVTLLGRRLEGSRVALFAIGPGPKAVHTAGFHEPDIEYVNRERSRLLESFPRLEWIGSLHVHPFGMPWLSGHDRHTIRKILTEAGGLYMPDFIAGIIQRQGPSMLIYPYLALSADFEPRIVSMRILPDNTDLVRRATEAAKESSGLAGVACSEAERTHTDLRPWYARLCAGIRRATRNLGRRNYADGK
jgi:hypothetical protein